jgi:excisionase family DNA binding protein
MTPRDAARALRCSVPHVLRLIRSRCLPARRLGRRWILRRDDFLASLAPDAATCADCAKPVAPGHGVVGTSGLVTCASCSRRLRGADGGR